MADSVVTNVAKEKMVKARAGISTLPPIAGMAFGDGAVNGASIRTPLATDTGLQHELLRQTVDGHEYKASNLSVVYTCTLSQTALANNNINEIALYDSAGDLVAIKSFSNKGKDEDMEMVFTIEDMF